jgi:hypothetical protein
MVITTMDGRDKAVGLEELVQTLVSDTTEPSVLADNREAASGHERIPWIGALRNPRLGPMVVLDDNGYLVPLCTASDLLRGCRYFWRASQD